MDRNNIQRVRRRARAQRLKGFCGKRCQFDDDSGDEFPERQKRPKRPTRRKKPRIFCYDEDIIDGFAIASFCSYEYLQKAVRVSDSLGLKQLLPPYKKVSNIKKSLASKIDSNQMDNSTGYLCDLSCFSENDQTHTTFDSLKSDTDSDVFISISRKPRNKKHLSQAHSNAAILYTASQPQQQTVAKSPPPPLARQPASTGSVQRVLQRKFDISTLTCAPPSSSSIQQRHQSVAVCAADSVLPVTTKQPHSVTARASTAHTLAGDCVAATVTASVSLCVSVVSAGTRAHCVSAAEAHNAAVAYSTGRLPLAVYGVPAGDRGVSAAPDHAHTLMTSLGVNAALHGVAVSASVDSVGGVFASGGGGGKRCLPLSVSTFQHSRTIPSATVRPVAHNTASHVLSKPSQAISSFVTSSNICPKYTYRSGITDPYPLSAYHNTMPAFLQQYQSNLPLPSSSLHVSSANCDALRRELDTRFLSSNAAAVSAKIGINDSSILSANYCQVRPTRHVTSNVFDNLSWPSLYNSLCLTAPHAGSPANVFGEYPVSQRPNIAPAASTTFPSAAKSLIHPTPSVVKKQSKWNAMHVRIAWEIYSAQQEQNIMKLKLSQLPLSANSAGHSLFTPPVLSLSHNAPPPASTRLHLAAANTHQSPFLRYPLPPPGESIHNYWVNTVPRSGCADQYSSSAAGSHPLPVDLSMHGTQPRHAPNLASRHVTGARAHATNQIAAASSSSRLLAGPSYLYDTNRFASPATYPLAASMTAVPGASSAALLNTHHLLNKHVPVLYR